MLCYITGAALIGIGYFLCRFGVRNQEKRRRTADVAGILGTLMISVGAFMIVTEPWWHDE